MAQSNEVNTVTLSKGSYDSMRSTNDRAGMLLSRIIDTITIADDRHRHRSQDYRDFVPGDIQKEGFGSRNDSHEELFETQQII